MPRHSRPIALLLILATLVVVPAAATAAAEAEEYHYRWRLSKFLGVIASLFFPSRGEGVLSFTPTDDGILLSELLITSAKSDDGEYWRYGSQMDLETERTLRAWSSYRWRGKEREREGEVEDEGVVDVVSGIYGLRRDPPEKARNLEIWSDGKIYPVTVVPLGVERRKIGKVRVEARHLSIRGRKVPGANQWKGRLDLWFALDEVSTPVEILIYRSGVGVHLELLEVP